MLEHATSSNLPLPLPSTGSGIGRREAFYRFLRDTDPTFGRAPLGRTTPPVDSPGVRIDTRTPNNLLPFQTPIIPRDPDHSATKRKPNNPATGLAWSVNPNTKGTEPRTLANMVYRTTTDQSPVGTLTVTDVYRMVRAVVNRANRSGVVRIPSKGKKPDGTRTKTVKTMNRQYRSVDVQDLVQDVVGTITERAANKKRTSIGLAIRQEDVRRNKGTGYWSTRYERPSPDGYGWVSVSHKAVRELVAARKAVVLSGDATLTEIERVERQGMVPVRENKLIVRHLTDIAPDTTAEAFVVQETFGKLRSVLATLTATEQTVMIAYALGMHPEQIADSEGMSRATVYNIIQRIKAA